MSLSVSEFPLQLEYKKHSNIAPADIARLRDWLHTQPHMPDKYITDLDLILAYHSCNCSMEVTKQVLDLHYTFKTHSLLFKERDLHQATINCLSAFVTMPLKHHTFDGCAILFTGFVTSDPKDISFIEAARASHMAIDLWQYEVGTFPGFHYIVDMQRVTLAHLSTVDLNILQQTFRFLEDMMLLKIVAIHLINAPSFVDKVISFLKPFVKKDLMNELHIHLAGSSSLSEYLPVSALPADAGGDQPSVREAAAHTIQKLKDNRAFFLAEEKKRVNEELRSTKPKIITDMFGGVEGSFKKLEID